MRSYAVRSVLVALALAVAPVSWAAESDDDDRARTGSAKGDPDEVVCRRIKVTGSHMRQRVCHKQREWDQMREDSQSHMQNRRPSYVPSQNQ